MAKPVKCQRCGRENDPSFAYCLDCGQPLKLAAPGLGAPDLFCTACGARLQVGFKFCGQCGTPVGGPAPALAKAPAGSTPARGAVAPASSPPRTVLTAVAAPHPAPRLVTVRHDGLPGSVYPLEHEEATCGRTEGEIRLVDDPTVSPRHARFSRHQGVLRVEDLGSLNGTYLRLKGPHRLSVGEEIRLGRQLLRLEPLPRPAASELSTRAWGSPDVGAMLRLTQLLDGGGVGEIFPLQPGENAVGREGGDITFSGDRYVSARHARIEVAEGAVTLTDLGSSNGTFIKVTGAMELVNGDQLLLGSQLLRVEV
jgi:FHA domain/Double zinc ribbon